MDTKIEPGSRMKNMGFAAVACSSMFSGCEGVLTQLCYKKGFNYFTVLSVRYCLACLVFLFVVMLTRSPLIVPREYRFRTLIVGLTLVATAALLNMAFRMLPATVAVLFFYSYLLMTGISSKLIFKQHLGFSRVLALFFSIFGLIMLYMSSLADIMMIGVVCALGAGLIHTVKMNLSETFSNNCPPVTYAFNILFVCSIFFIYASLFTGSLHFQVESSGWLYILILGIIITSGGNLLFFWGLGKIGSVDTSIMYLFEPVTSAAVAFLAFGDLLSPLQIAGGLLILFAIFLPVIKNLKEKSNKLT